jgi:hypothetical protein
VSTNHEACTHIVVANDSFSLSDCSPRVYVVKQEVSTIIVFLDIYAARLQAGNYRVTEFS